MSRAIADPEREPLVLPTSGSRTRTSSPIPSVVHVARSPDVSGSVVMPGSKSVTNRAILICGLAEGTSEITQGLAGGDATSMAKGLVTFGATVDDTATTRSRGRWRIEGNCGRLPAGPLVVDAELAGTTLRFLTAVGVLGSGDILVTGSPPLLERPVGPLLSALRTLGAEVFGSGPKGDRAPVSIGRRTSTLGGPVGIDASQSSQFVTALLLAAPYFDVDLTLHHRGLGARGFVTLTAELMLRHGAHVELGRDIVRVAAGTGYRAGDEVVPPDASAASHMFTLAVASGGSVRVVGLQAAWRQPDFAFLDVLELAGARVVRWADGSVTVDAPEQLRPIDVDLTLMPDQLPNVAVLAALARGRSRIRGVGITRFHESDRIAAVATEFAKANVPIEIDGDEVVIHGGCPTGPTEFSSRGDHRMAMALAAIGAAIGESAIEGADAVSKTYQDFWVDASTLGLNVTAPGELP